MAAESAIARQAAEWIVLLTDDDAAERERASREFEAWKQADPRHAAAAVEMENLIGRVGSVRQPAAGGGRAARAALDAVFGGARKRRGIRRSLAVFLLAVTAPAFLALQAWSPAYLLADLRTRTGQWETHALPDGTQLTLGSNSAVNLRFDARARAIELVQGEILVDVAADAHRPFTVDTSHGRVRALGTRFVVDRQDAATLVSMIESRVLVQTAVALESAEQRGVELAAGQQVRISAGKIGAIEAIDRRALADGWKYHHLVVHDRPLGEVLELLARYRPGHLAYQPESLAGIRVTAVLPLDDTDRALQLLLDSFPTLRVRHFTPLWVSIDAPVAPP